MRDTRKKRESAGNGVEYTQPVVKRLPEGYLKPSRETIRQMKTLARGECANCFDGGKLCVMIDRPCFQFEDGYLLCSYFKECVLPLDKALRAMLTPEYSTTNCSRCGKDFAPTNKRQEYCPECSAATREERDASKAAY